MAGLFDIRSIVVKPDSCTVTVAVLPGMPLMTSDDLEGTAAVYYLAPGIVDQTCFGDAGSVFKDCMGNTEMAHLLEHLTIEIMSKTGLAGSVVCGRTRAVPNDQVLEMMDGDDAYLGRVFETDLTCPDDVLTVGALSSAAFIMDWAFLHRTQPAPDFNGTVTALAQLVESVTAHEQQQEVQQQ